MPGRRSEEAFYYAAPERRLARVLACILHLLEVLLRPLADSLEQRL